MPMITTDDGVTLHAEDTGTGEPLLFIHEFAGDHRSWEPQVRFFSGGYRCLTYAARGYPPSGVPADGAAYSQDRAIADAVAVLDGLAVKPPIDRPATWTRPTPSPSSTATASATARSCE